jgi:hypothetical protein
VRLLAYKRLRLHPASRPRGRSHPILKPHQSDIVRWAVRGGRRAIFARFGLGKTMMQLETMRLVLARRRDGRGVAAASSSRRSASGRSSSRTPAKLGSTLRFIRTTAEVTGPGLYLTNYESVREGKIDTTIFRRVSLDEAAILRGFGGTKTFREFMRRFDRTPYRFVATATPAPNEYIEILSYAAFLGVMDVGEAKTRFFKRNSEKADQLTLHPHKEEEFWIWVNTWAVFVQRPSDLGYSDEGYDLPPLDGPLAPGQADVAPDPSRSTGGAARAPARDAAMGGSLGVVGAAREKRASLPDRSPRCASSSRRGRRARRHLARPRGRAPRDRARDPRCRRGLRQQDLDEREGTIADFARGRIARSRRSR